MKNIGHSSALLVPEAQGWRARIKGVEGKVVPTLEEALAGVPASTHIELALPCHAVLLERHQFPATDRAELADMIQLQLEKTLPFPVEEVSHGFEVLQQDENESTILSVAASHAQLDQICAPLRSHGRLPERITLNALRLAGGCPPGEVSLAAWAEQDQLVVALVSDEKLSWAHVISSLEADTILSELPGLLISAELDGVNTNFANIRLGPDCSHLEQPLASAFRKPVLPLSDDVEAKSGLDLLPVSWQDEARRQSRGEKLKQNLLMAAVVYLLLVACGFGYLAWMKVRAQKLQAEVQKLKPEIDVIDGEKARWDVMGAAILPERSALEVLHQLTKSRAGNASLQFTGFNYSPREWVLKGEGANEVYFTFCQDLKKNADLNETFDLTYPNPTILKEEKVGFTITGKPRLH